MKKQIVVVDDEKEVADLLELYLENEGYQVYKFYESRELLAHVRAKHVDLAVIDIMMPDMDGFALCKAIRQDYFFPIIMLTAKVEDTDKISGLMLGADDYITKPFNPLELIARVKTQLRRYTRYNAGSVEEMESPPHVRSAEECDIRGLYINNTTHICKLYEKELDLTPTEFSILWYLCERRGKVVSSEELFEAVWGEKYLESNNTVMAHIGKIREKMNESYKHPKFIKTVWGVGYMMEA